MKTAYSIFHINSAAGGYCAYISRVRIVSIEKKYKQAVVEYIDGADVRPGVKPRRALDFRLLFSTREKALARLAGLLDARPLSPAADNHSPPPERPIEAISKSTKTAPAAE